MQNSKNQTIRQSMTYDTIRGQFIQDLNWSRFRPTELHNFAKNVGVLGKRKSLICLIFRDLPNLKSFKSGATRNRTGDTRIFSPLLYQLSYGTSIFMFATNVSRLRLQRYANFWNLQTFQQKKYDFCAKNGIFVGKVPIITLKTFLFQSPILFRSEKGRF